MRITQQHVSFDDDGQAEFDLPDPPERAMHHSVKFERLNDRAVTVYTASILWTEEDDAEYMELSLDMLDDDEV